MCPVKTGGEYPPLQIEKEVISMLPQDPVILLSYVNTKLRDDYPSLDALCDDLDADREELVQKLEGINYRYSLERNQFL